MGGKGAHDCYLARAKYLPNHLSNKPETTRPRRTSSIEKRWKEAKTRFPVRVAMQKVAVRPACEHTFAIGRDDAHRTAAVSRATRRRDHRTRRAHPGSHVPL